MQERALHSKPQIKICGLSTPETLEAAIGFGADLVGFVFFAPSPRNLTLDQAQALAQQVAGRAQKVALSVDAKDDDLRAIIAHMQPDLLQLHGQESPERFDSLCEVGDPGGDVARLVSSGVVERTCGCRWAAALYLHERWAGSQVIPNVSQGWYGQMGSSRPLVGS